MEEHGYSSDLSDAARQAINSGNDIDMESAAYLDHLEDLINTGQVTESRLNDAVSRVLHLKLKLGLFEYPYHYYDLKREKKMIGHLDNLNAARDS